MFSKQQDNNKRSHDEYKRDRSSRNRSFISSVNILNCSPAHMLIIACRQKMDKEKDWKKLLEPEILEAVEHLDPNLEKTYPLVLCIALGQRYYPCLRQRNRCHDFVMFRNANILLQRLLGSSPAQYFSDTCRFLNDTPSMSDLRQSPDLASIMSFADHFQFDTRLSSAHPSSLPDEHTLIIALQTYHTMSIHTSPDCPSMNQNCCFYNFEQQKLPTPVVSNQQSYSSLNNQPGYPPAQVTLFDRDLLTFVNNCCSLTGESNNLAHMISTPCRFQRDYQRLMSHAQDPSDHKLADYATVIFHLAELHRHHHDDSFRIDGRISAYLSLMMRSFRAATVTLRDRCTRESLAYSMPSSLRHQIVPADVSLSPGQRRDICCPLLIKRGLKISDCKESYEIYSSRCPTAIGPDRSFSSSNKNKKRKRRNTTPTPKQGTNTAVSSSTSSVYVPATTPSSNIHTTSSTNTGSATTSPDILTSTTTFNGSTGFDTPLHNRESPIPPPTMLRRSSRLQSPQVTECIGLSMITQGYPSSDCPDGENFNPFVYSPVNSPIADDIFFTNQPVLANNLFDFSLSDSDTQ